MKRIMNSTVIWMAALFAILIWTGTADAVTLSVTDPTTGNNVDITIPDNPGEAFDAVTKDMTRLLEQAGAAVDELVASVSGCLTDESGKAMVGTMVFLINSDIIPEPAYGVTAGETGVGLFSQLGVPVPKPGLDPGCYWIPIPPSITGSLVGLLNGGSSDLTGTNAGFYVYPVAPGYNFVPPAQNVSINQNGSFYKTPIENLGEILSTAGIEEGTSR